jgi:hypothetical protein
MTFGATPVDHLQHALNPEKRPQLHPLQLVFVERNGVPEIGA